MTDAPRLQRNLVFGWEAERREQPADEPRPASLSSSSRRLFCGNGGRAGRDALVIPCYSVARLFCGTASCLQDYIRCMCHNTMSSVSVNADPDNPTLGPFRTHPVPSCSREIAGIRGRKSTLGLLCCFFQDILFP